MAAFGSQHLLADKGQRMGKVYDALEKSGIVQELTIVEPHTEKPDQASEAQDTVIEEKRNGPFKTQSTVTLDSTLITYHDPGCVEAEIFKILRTNLLFPKEGTPPRSIMVTSAIPGDGKSFVASNLAISIAQGIEEHVLLMDCDIRRSSIHKRFGFHGPVRGLSDHLSKGRPLSSLLKKTVIEKLTILPGGSKTFNPSELLSSTAMREMMEETKHRYKDRYIIVDSPPPQLTAETTALANYVDGIIIVVKYGSTPRDMVKDLVEKFGTDKFLGVVMNCYRVPTTERYGYGKYDRYKMKY